MRPITNFALFAIPSLALMMQYPSASNAEEDDPILTPGFACTAWDWTFIDCDPKKVDFQSGTGVMVVCRNKNVAFGGHFTAPESMTRGHITNSGTWERVENTRTYTFRLTNTTEVMAMSSNNDTLHGEDACITDANRKGGSDLTDTQKLGN